MSENNLQDLHKLIDDTNGNVVVIKPFETDDLYLGKQISASVTEGGHFSQISIGNRNHVFSRKTGEWAGSDIDCVSKSTQEKDIRQTKKYCFMEEGYIYVDAFEEIVERLRKECLGDCYIPYNSITENIPVKRSIRRGNEYPAYDYNALKKRFQDTIKCLQAVLGEMERINAEDKVDTEYYKVIEVVEFGKTKDIDQVKQAVSKEAFAKFEPPVTKFISITEDEFLYLNKRFSSKRRHDTFTE